MTETDITNTKSQTDGLLERILDRKNLNEAFKQVKRNKGAGGVDGMQVDDLLPYLKEHGTEILQSLRGGKYRPKPVRRVEIPKENGKVRKLGIPTVVDRMIQQAISQVLTPIYEEQFSDNSFGFRPGRSAHDALRRCQKYITEGYIYAVDIDLEKYFDTVNQSKLVQVLSETIKDGRVISLIHRFLRAGIMADGVFEESPEGVPQEDHSVPSLGTSCSTNATGAGKARTSICALRGRSADLLQEQAGSGAHPCQHHQVPGTEVVPEGKPGEDKGGPHFVRQVSWVWLLQIQGEARLRVHPKSVQKLKDKVRQVTGRSNGMGIDERRARLNQLIRGWVNYFKLADMKNLMQQLDEWARRRIRMVTWKRWKKVRARFENLKRLGVSAEQAWMWANTRKGYWRIANSPILKLTLSNERFRRMGYLSFSDYYSRVKA